MRMIVSLGLFLVLTLGAASGEEIKGKIIKIDDKGVTLLVKNSTDDKGKTYVFAKDCKFNQKNKDAKDEIKDGFKGEVFQNLPAKGISATITTNDKNEATEVLVTKKKKQG